MALLLCLMLLQNSTQGPSLFRLLPSIRNNITSDSIYSANQTFVPLPSPLTNERGDGAAAPTNKQSPAPLLAQAATDPPFPDTFHSSIAVIIGLLSIMFALSFLVLLYAKHSKRIPLSLYEERDIPSLRYHLNYYHHYEAGASRRAVDSRPMTNAGVAPARVDSGIDQYVVESLPRFPFSILKGMKDGLECAVCLSRYESTDVLRLLPMCKHAFHLDCIDLWLLHHSTCPLCRHRIEDNEGMLDMSHSQELENFLSHYRPWASSRHEDSARIPTVWEHSDRISQDDGGQHSTRFRTAYDHSARMSSVQSARFFGSGRQALILAPQPQHASSIPELLEESVLEFHLQREVEGVDDDANTICCNGSNSWRKLEGVQTESSATRKNDVEEGKDEWALVEKLPKEGHRQRWAPTAKGMAMTRRRMDESWRKGGDKYYDEEVMKRLRHRINIIPLFSSHTIRNGDAAEAPTAMEHHYSTSSAASAATARCMSEISCRHQMMGSL